MFRNINTETLLHLDTFYFIIHKEVHFSLLYGPRNLVLIKQGLAIKNPLGLLALL